MVLWCNQQSSSCWHPKLTDKPKREEIRSDKSSLNFKDTKQQKKGVICFGKWLQPGQFGLSGLFL